MDGPTPKASDSKNQDGLKSSTTTDVGFRVAEYEIIGKLGHGSMATVYLARDNTGHEVALKLFSEGPGVSPTMMERFRRESDAAKKLRRHPNIIKVYATGQDGMYHYIAMEVVKNSRTLEDVLERTPMTIGESVRLVVKIARALHYGHTRNIVHRDVKPGNIMINEFGEPLLADFGVVAMIDWPTCTVTGALTGTPLYMAPEQARADEVFPSSDIYSLGVILFEALTGELPYNISASSPVKRVLEAVQNDPIKRPRSLRKEISPDLEAVILMALQKEPANRYQDAESFASDLERALAGKRVTAKIFSLFGAFLSFFRRHAQASGTLLMLICVLLVAWLFFRHQLLNERYETLLKTIPQHRALLQDHIRQSEVAAETDPSGGASSPGDAWHDIRMARRVMSLGQWSSASAAFTAVAERSLTSGDARTAAIAQIDLARCEATLGNFNLAISHYRSIMANTDAPPLLADYAQIDALTLALLSANQELAMEMTSARAKNVDSTTELLVSCLTGETKPGDMKNKIAQLPKRLKNDGYMAMAVRAKVEEEASAYESLLNKVVKFSSPSQEWPAPLARSLLTKKNAKGAE